jgi:hypothetical protein
VAPPAAAIDSDPGHADDIYVVPDEPASRKDAIEAAPARIRAL